MRSPKRVTKSGFAETHLRVGDIVTDIDEESQINGMQGEVVHIQMVLWGRPEVYVRFDRCLDPFSLLWQIGDQESKNSKYCIERYVDDDLRRDRDWIPEIHADRLFRHHWNFIKTKVARLDPRELCDVDGCTHYQSHEVWVNTWGTVFNVYVCGEHRQEYTKYPCMDSFPHRKKKVSVA